LLPLRVTPLSLIFSQNYRILIFFLSGDFFRYIYPIGGNPTLIHMGSSPLCPSSPLAPTLACFFFKEFSGAAFFFYFPGISGPPPPIRRGGNYGKSLGDFHLGGETPRGCISFLGPRRFVTRMSFLRCPRSEGPSIADVLHLVPPPVAPVLNKSLLQNNVTFPLWRLPFSSLDGSSSLSTIMHCLHRPLSDLGPNPRSLSTHFPSSLGRRASIPCSCAIVLLTDAWTFWTPGSVLD